MSIYQYEAITDYGKKIRGSISAVNRVDAIKILVNRNFTLLKIKKVLFVFHKLNMDDLVLFFMHIDFQIKCGVPICKAIENFSLFCKSEKLRIAILQIILDLKSGKNLYESFLGQSEVFGTAIPGVLKAGENGSDLHDILLKIIDFLQSKIRWRSKLQSCLSYPIFTMLIAVSVLILSVFWIGPQVTSTIESMGIKNVSEFENYGLMLASQCIGNNFSKLASFFVICILVYIKYKNINIKYFLKFSKIYYLIKQIYLWNIFSVISVLVDSKIDILTAIELATFSTKHKEIGSKLQLIKKKIIDGESIAKAFSLLEELPHHILIGLEVGQQNNKLSETFKHIVNIQRNQLELDISRVAKRVSVYLLLFAGAVFIYILLTMLAPMYAYIDVVSLS